MSLKERYINLALKEAKKGVMKNHGGPFGAIIVKNNEIIARAHNTVIKTNDPTAHAEINAIRKASKKIKNFNLSNCEIYTTCEPCPMCLSAIFWARIDKIYYLYSREDAERIGFDDNKIYKVFEDKEKLNIEKLNIKDEFKTFELWKNKNDKTMY